MQTGQEALGVGITIREFCNSVGVPGRSYFLWKKDKDAEIAEKKKGRKTPPTNKLTPKEKKEVVCVLLDLKWSDFSPREIYYKLLDEEGRIIASVSPNVRIHVAST